MRLTLRSTPGAGTYVCVWVAAHELATHTSKRYPHETIIGIFAPGKRKLRLDIWQPASGAPRGYARAAKLACESMRAEAIALLEGPRAFDSLPIGATFDFIGPDRMLNSFYDRCTKTSARGYEWTHASGQKLCTNVGSVHCKVYNVKE